MSERLRGEDTFARFVSQVSGEAAKKTDEVRPVVNAGKSLRPPLDQHRSHPSHADLKEWAGEYGPATFNALPIKFALSRFGTRHNPARARLAKKKHSALLPDRREDGTCPIILFW